VLQPHRYTRLRDNLEGFAMCMDAADLVVLTDVYAAGEAPIPGASTDALAERLVARRPPGTVVVERDFASLPGRLVDLSRAGDLLITLGAGSITRVGPAVLEGLRKR
jgi:UDP-N-acetylmuramate--alanine ligase